MFQLSSVIRRPGFRANATNPVVFILVTAFCLGALNGLIFHPLWMEITELAQVVAGTVHYNANNPWYYEINSSLTLLTFIPAALLKFGLSAWTLSLISSALMSGIAFSSVAVLAYTFSQSRLFSIVMPFLLLNYSFGNSHYYPVIFPLSFFSFGQIGLFLAILCLALLALQMRRSAGFLIGFLPALHPGWAIIVWATTAGYIAFSWRTLQTKSFMLSFLAGAILFLAAFGLQRQVVPPQHTAVIATFDRHQQFLDASRLRLVWSQRDENGNPTSHNLLVHEAPKPVIELFKFFSGDLLVLVFALLGIFVFSKRLPSPALIYLRLSIIFISIVSLLKFAEEIGPHFFWLASISESLPFYLQRVIVGRWLNLDTLAIPVIFLGSLAFLAFSAKNVIAFLTLTISAIFIMKAPAWTLNPMLQDSTVNHSWMSSIVVVTIALCFFSDRGFFASRVLPRVMVNSTLIFLVCLAAVAARPLTEAVKQVVINKPFLGSDKFDEISLVASARPELLVLAPGVRGIQDYNPQLRTGRPIAMSLPIFVRGSDAEVADPQGFNEKLYCFEMYAWDAPFHLTERIKTCFEGRTASEWKAIEREFGATSVLVPDGWKLNLPLTKSSAGLSLYDINSAL